MLSNPFDTTPKTVKEALRQSATAAENGYKVRWEVPNGTQAARAQKLFDDHGITNINVSVVPQ